ncbi:MAG TPA: o-succinylbenzoate synthase [Microthrixaceae bacterium]|nr:o-succinylbenzoate synthase [Microthrixaceae bacterium]HNI36003.1 o-succinylbenzoate synthase [Microthrixaceae bacterium]
MRIEAIDVIAVRLPLRSPWHTTAGTLNGREVLLVRLRSDIGEGWGECAAFAEPGYSAEFVASARLVLRDHLAPRLLTPTEVTSTTASLLMAPVAGHRMAKSALEMAMIDAELRAEGRSFAESLGVTRTHVDAGVAIGFAGSPAELCDRIASYVDAGYRRVKLKIAPGRDLDYISAARDQFPALALQVDANGAYTVADIDHLAALDEFALLLVEQPFGDDDLVGHALLANRLRTPVCLDEPIVSVDTTASAVALGACDVVNLKAGRVGGYVAARAIHDWCVERNIPLWCGGMLETGLGRAANVALAALDGFTLPGDLSASARFYETDIVTDPIVVEHGGIAVPSGPGFGVELDLDLIERFRVA